MKASFLDSWSQKVARLRNRSFLDAAMAAAALVSTADADVRLAEQLALDEVLTRVEKLQLFDPKSGAELHRRYAEQLGAADEPDRTAALASVATFKGDEERGLLILYVGAVVAKADGTLSKAEEHALEDIAQALGLPAEASLRRVFEGEVEA